MHQANNKPQQRTHTLEFQHKQHHASANIVQTHHHMYDQHSVFNNILQNPNCIFSNLHYMSCTFVTCFSQTNTTYSKLQILCFCSFVAFCNKMQRNCNFNFCKLQQNCNQTSTKLRHYNDKKHYKTTYAL